MGLYLGRCFRARACGGVRVGPRLLRSRMRHRHRRIWSLRGSRGALVNVAVMQGGMSKYLVIHLELQGPSLSLLCR